jgi:membrane protein CcdC involved in cytochrome C biogenesis
MDQRQIVTATVIGVAVVAVVALRLSRTLKPQPLNLSRLWLWPAILALLSAVVVSKLSAPGAGFYAFLAGALVLGGGLGWLRAKTIRLSVDPQSRQIVAQGSAAAVIFLVGLILVRIVIRWSVASGSVVLPLSPQEFDAVFLVFAAALFLARTAEMALRARQILSGAATA